MQIYAINITNEVRPGAKQRNFSYQLYTSWSLQARKWSGWKRQTRVVRAEVCLRYLRCTFYSVEKTWALLHFLAKGGSTWCAWTLCAQLRVGLLPINELHFVPSCGTVN